VAPAVNCLAALFLHVHLALFKAHLGEKPGGLVHAFTTNLAGCFYFVFFANFEKASWGLLGMSLLGRLLTMGSTFFTETEKGKHLFLYILIVEIIFG